MGEVPGGCHAELEIEKVQSSPEKVTAGRSTRRSGPPGRPREAGKWVGEAEAEVWRDGGQLCGESAEWGATWAW